MRKEVIQLRCSAQEKERWKEIATMQHLELSAWIRLTLDKATRGAEARRLLDHPDVKA